MEKKRTFKPIGFLIIGILFLIVPSAIYLGFLIPKMSEQYIILMSSGAGIGGAGMFGTGMIPETAKFGTLYKTASKALTMLVVITLVQNFIGQLIGLAATFAVSYVIYRIFKEAWKHGRQRTENRILAQEVAGSVVKASQ